MAATDRELSEAADCGSAGADGGAGGESGAWERGSGGGAEGWRIDP